MKPQKSLVVVIYFLMTGFLCMGQGTRYEEIFVETFVPNKLDWPVNTTDARINQIQNNSYSFKHISDNKAALLAREVPIVFPDNFRVEANIKYVSGDGSGYGVIFNYSDPGNFHTINISSNGYFRYGYYRYGNYTEPIPWTQVGINGGGVPNIIRIEYKDDKLLFAINGILVRELPRPEEIGTKIGFIVYGKQEIEISRLGILANKPIVLAAAEEKKQESQVVEKTAEKSDVSKVEETTNPKVELPTTGVSAYQNKFALVIGNSDYNVSPLKNPKNDAVAMGKELESVGFTVTTLINADRSAFRKAIVDFSKQLIEKPGVGLFYYAGHGLQSNGVNYLVPIGAALEAEFEVEDECIRADRVLRMLNSMENPMNIVILDACRNNPFASSFRSADRGLATPNYAPTGSIIAFATAPGKTASDGDGDNGLYTQEFINTMRVPGLTIEQVFKQVRINVSQKSEGKQIPWENSSLMGDFYFK